MILVLGAVILAILFQLAAALPATDMAIDVANDIANNASSPALHDLDSATRGYSSWASFCDDDDCTEGCGQWVDISNPGCLGENYRRSVRFHTYLGPTLAGGLVYSPADSCDCQTECDNFSFTSSTGCMVLNSSISYETFSYRFIGQWCDTYGNQC